MISIKIANDKVFVHRQTDGEVITIPLRHLMPRGKKPDLTFIMFNIKLESIYVQKSLHLLFFCTKSVNTAFSMLNIRNQNLRGEFLLSSQILLGEKRVVNQNLGGSSPPSPQDSH